MLENFNSHFSRLKLGSLVGFYILQFLIYVLLPNPLGFLKQFISPLMAVTLVVIFYRAIIGSSLEK